MEQNVYQEIQKNLETCPPGWGCQGYGEGAQCYDTIMVYYTLMVIPNLCRNKRWYVLWGNSSVNACEKPTTHLS